MITHTFYKYQGTGNDFVMIDHRESKWIDHDHVNAIKLICDRRFGIGGDGLILLENDRNHDFKMVYFNADGKQSSMCGNGGRCIVAFANKLGIIDKFAKFTAIDGLHEAEVLEDKIKLKMGDVDSVIRMDNVFTLDTGSPHYVQFVEDLKLMDIVKVGKRIRYSEPFIKEGINVNLVEIKEDFLEVQTFERGVEWETLSCGTGVTACALAFHLYAHQTNPINEVKIKTKGGILKVQFDCDIKTGKFYNIHLIGPAELVFKGEWSPYNSYDLRSF